MLLPLVFALLQAPTPSSGDARPVRVWLGSSGVLVRGTGVRVYVQAAHDGNLIVLHRRTDGRIEVLFPGKPGDDPFVRAGTYEIQATPSRVAFVVAEPDGSGLVLAALTSRMYRFDEFVRAAAWSPEALAPTWDGSDGEGALSDIVQRMLGDGYFNYDIAAYTVAPPMYAAQPDSAGPYPVYPTCTDCTFIGYQENAFESVFLCDPFFSPCLGDGRFPRGRPRKPQEPAPAPTRTIALAMRAPSSASPIPRDGRKASPREPFVRKSAAPVSQSRAVGPPPRPRAPVQVVRLALSPTRLREDPEDGPERAQSIPLTGLTVTPPAPARSTRLARAPAPPADAIPTAAAMVPRTRAMAVASGGGANRGEASGAAATTPPPERGRTVALPPAVFQGAQARVPVARTGGRRR